MGTCLLFKHKVRNAKQSLEIISDSAWKQKFPKPPLSNFLISFIVDYSESALLTLFSIAPISTPYVSAETFCALRTDTKYRKKLDPQSD